jgi:hypothetical protein
MVSAGGSCAGTSEITQEAEIRRITVGSQSGQFSHETLPGKYSTQKALSGRVAPLQA